MRTLVKLAFSLALLLGVTAGASAQSSIGGGSPVLASNGVPVGTCSIVSLDVDVTTGNFYDCLATLWNPVGTGTGIPPTPLINNQLISGGGVVWTGNLNFTVSAANYDIVSTNYSSPQTNLTLATADPTNPRIDMFILDTSGTASVITGTPAANPAAPVPDPTTQLAISFVTVPANSSTPSVTNILVYDENVGTPTEWNCTPSANFNCNSTNTPFHLTHDIEVTNAVSGNNVVLANSTTVNLGNLNTLSFYILNKAVWPNAKSLSICFLNGSTIVGSCVGFKNGTFGFNQSNTSTYQQMVIPLSNFFTGTSSIVDRVRFQVAGGSSAIGFFIDWIQIQSSSGGGSGSTVSLSANQRIRTCNMVVGADNGSAALVNADLGPQTNQCKVNQPSTVQEITLSVDNASSTTNVQVRKRHCSTFTSGSCTAFTTTNLLSAVLGAASTADADSCATASASLPCLDGTTSSATVVVSTTALAAGDWLELASGTADGTTKRATVTVSWVITATN